MSHLIISTVLLSLRLLFDIFAQNQHDELDQRDDPPLWKVFSYLISCNLVYLKTQGPRYVDWSPWDYLLLTTGG